MLHRRRSTLLTGTSRKARKARNGPIGLGPIPSKPKNRGSPNGRGSSRIISITMYDGDLSNAQRIMQHKPYRSFSECVRDLVDKEAARIKKARKTIAKPRRR